MKNRIELKNTTHDFQKTNLMTLRDCQGLYDTMRCSLCGVTGKRRQINAVDIDGRTADRNLETCPKAEKSAIPKKVKITNFGGYSSNFRNITEGSIHEVVEPLDSEYKKKFPNSPSSVWVMGTREPTRLLPGEFEVIE